jgi:hypothetical protein
MELRSVERGGGGAARCGSVFACAAAPPTPPHVLTSAAATPPKPTHKHTTQTANLDPAAAAQAIAIAQQAAAAQVARSLSAQQQQLSNNAGLASAPGGAPRPASAPGGGPPQHLASAPGGTSVTHGPGGPGSGADICSEVVINDAPAHIRALLTKHDTASELSRRHHVAIATRGRYIAGGAARATGTDRPLYLRVTPGAAAGQVRARGVGLVCVVCVSALDAPRAATQQPTPPHASCPHTGALPRRHRLRPPSGPPSTQQQQTSTRSCLGCPSRSCRPLAQPPCRPCSSSSSHTARLAASPSQEACTAHHLAPCTSMAAWSARRRRQQQQQGRRHTWQPPPTWRRRLPPLLPPPTPRLLLQDTLPALPAASRSSSHPAGGRTLSATRPRTAACLWALRALQSSGCPTGSAAKVCVARVARADVCVCVCGAHSSRCCRYHPLTLCPLLPPRCAACCTTTPPPGGAFLAHIAAKSGATVVLTGRGSTGAGAPAAAPWLEHIPMHISITANNPQVRAGACIAWLCSCVACRHRAACLSSRPA